METLSGRLWKSYRSHFLGMGALVILFLFFLVAIYAPFLASSKPLFVYYNGEWFFPLFRYLFFSGFYTKRLDLFFNLMIFTFPLFCLSWLLPGGWRRWGCGLSLALQMGGFLYIIMVGVKDPAANGSSPHQMTPYEQLNMVLYYRQRLDQQRELSQFEEAYRKQALNRWLASAVQNEKASLLRRGIPASELPDDVALKQLVLEQSSAHLIDKATAMPTLWNIDRLRTEERLEQLKAMSGKDALQELHTLEENRRWLEEENGKLHYMAMPLLRNFHWEEEAGGKQSLNRLINWWELTRVNRKDMLSALIFGVRISLIVGAASVALAMALGIPIGALAGYYGGRFDILVSRLLEVWEAMPIFFMLLLVVAIVQSKSIFLIVAVIGLFSWTSFSRYIRGEFFKQRSLSYIEACRANGFSDRYIIFSHILPNAIPPVLTLMPFAVMAAITSEAGLSFLGLGEEGSCSWGVLMDEGRSAFPAESYLLWPPALLLTLLLIAIALVGETLRELLDPKSSVSLSR